METKWAVLRRIAILAAVVTLLAGCLPANAALAQGGSSATGSLVSAYPQVVEAFRAKILEMMETDGIPGAAVILVDDEQVLWAEGFGIRERGKPEPVDPDTIFSIQSITKTFTATAIMEAVNNGLLDLDEPITTYLPDFTVNSVFEEHPERKITLRLLLSHYAGFTQEAPVGGNWDANDATFEEHIASISRTWLRFPVGQDYAYSNLGIDLAGYILGKVTGRGFVPYVDDFLTTKVGLESSTLDMVKVRENPNRAAGHGSLQWKIAPNIAMIPAGGLYSSVSDMGKFIQYHLKNREALAQMYRVAFPAPGQPEGYALGIGTSVRHGTVYHDHGGGGYGFSSSLIWYPELKIGVAVLTNSADTPPDYIWPYSMGEWLLDSIISDPASQYHTRLTQLKVKAPTSIYTSAYRAQKLTLDVKNGLRNLQNTPAPDTARWGRYVGQYGVKSYGSPLFSGPSTLAIHGDRLFWDGGRLTEAEPGLFFTEDGEALDLRGEPSFRNIELIKLPIGLYFCLIAAASGAALILVSSLICLLLSLIRHFRRGNAGAPVKKALLPKILQYACALVLLLGFGSAAFLLITASQAGPDYALSVDAYGAVRIAIQALHILSPFMILGALSGLALAAVSLLKRYWTVSQRVFCVLSAVGGLVLMAFMWQLNLILI